MTIQRVAIVPLPVKEQQDALRFYCDLLGFEVRADNEFLDANARWIEVAPPGSPTSFTLVTWFDSMPPGCITGLVLETDDIEADIAALQSRGLEMSPLETQMVGRFVTFQDPDGNGWVLQQNAQPPVA